MKVVKFIKSLNIEERPILNSKYLEYYRYEQHQPLSRVRECDLFIPVEEDMEKVCVPVHYFSKTNRREDRTQPEGHRDETIETVVAYSKEVQELLEMPFDIMHKKIDTLRNENRNLQDHNNNQDKIINDLNDELKSLKSSFFARLKFLFKPN